MTLGIILVINPKNTSSKIAVYKDSKLCFLKTIKYTDEQIAACGTIPGQLEMRKNAILQELKDNDININKLKIVIARGGLVKPVKSGVYEVNDRMREDLLKGVMGMHATNLGGIIAADIAALNNAKAIIADPVVVDELEEVARISGHPLFERKSIFHALNQKVVARKYAKSINRKYDELGLLVVHAGGGGISVGAHKNGKVVDTNQAFDGDGPFSIERAGTLPAGDLVKLCFSGKYSEKEVMEMITAKGGLYGYLGTTSLTTIEKRIAEGDEKAAFIMYAMAYQLAKEIGGMCTVLDGKPDAIILSGELFNNSNFTRDLSRKIEKIAPIALYPDENEVDALAMNAIGVMKGEIEVLQYS
ncbi:butyrate kinase [Lentimicrobium saccharophilum]|uniref:Probable butyrate kinase n=1 Tax=Lentimicrobium saccharophilum TaxID=1678841 RepID=A0A0S7BTH1_9BACT|nr:butyrate kinase [Lentimicrobium saccharophilum]GAP44197.1 butyrate kinase [Lentimicrobium saccharophilum]